MVDLILVIGGLVALAVILFIVLYNGLVSLRVKVENAFAQVDVQLKQRSDLVPNLVEAVKGYAKHEKSVFEDVTKARAAMMNAGSIAGKAQASDMLTGALKSLFAVAENYPQLRASENFKELQVELTDLESKIAYARQFYNDAVQDYNTQIAVLPNSLLAGGLGFQKKEFFQAAEEERKSVRVKF